MVDMHGDCMQNVIVKNIVNQWTKRKTQSKSDYNEFIADLLRK